MRDFNCKDIDDWILCETVLPGQGGVPRLAEVDFTDTNGDRDVNRYR